MASRDRLPGRRVGGEWRFAESEIHHWLEEKIGTSDAEALTEVERLLIRTAGVDEESIRLGDVMAVEAIAIPLQSRTRSSVIRDMCELAAKTACCGIQNPWRKRFRLAKKLHTTALENGVALLHPNPSPNRRFLSDSIVALGISSSPNSLRNAAGHLTDIFLLMNARSMTVSTYACWSPQSLDHR